MTPLQALQSHQQLCDELHQLALEENRLLQQHQRPPGPDFLERKRGLLGRLDETLAALREAPKGEDQGPTMRQALEKTRARILQILQLDKENEQLLLRFSLGATRPSAPTPAPAMPSDMLRKIYQRHS